MFRKISQFIRTLFSRTKTINNEPVNRASLVVIIIVDIFILINVFTGLYDISSWHLSPNEAYPCYQSWLSYRNNQDQDRDYNLAVRDMDFVSYDVNSANYLGQVSPICAEEARLFNQIRTAANREIYAQVGSKSEAINKLEAENSTIRSQYDSTLLEKIAGQPENLSINEVNAARAKQTLERNNLTIKQLVADRQKLQNSILSKPEVKKLIAFINSDRNFNEVKAGLEQASFWYPTIQITLQSIFLLPLIAIALIVHNFSNRRSYGLVALISWHLLIIFVIPFLIRVLEFFQIGIVLQIVADIVGTLLGNLLFLISYFYILLIAVLGFGIIKVFQKLSGDGKGKVLNRVQKSQCVRCAKKIRSQDLHCPYCGFGQYVTCTNCQTATYKFLPHCHNCGHPQDLS